MCPSPFNILSVISIYKYLLNEWSEINKKKQKTIVFQFKLLHRRLATNSFLTKINLKDNEQCTFCQNDTETLIHLFWNCNVSTLFWQDFKQWAVNRGELSISINLTAYLVLGLNPSKNISTF